MGSVMYIRKSGTTPDFLTAIVELVSDYDPADVTVRDPYTPFYSLSNWGRKHGYDYYTVKKRFFVLSETSVEYYASAKTKGKSAKGTIPLDLFTTCFRTTRGEPRQEDAVGYIKAMNHFYVRGIVEFDHGIRIRAPHISRSYYIFFDSEEIRDQWHRAVNYNIDRIREANPNFLSIAMRHAMQFVGSLGSTITLLKLALRYRFMTRPSVDDPSPQSRVLVSLRKGDYGALRKYLVDGSSYGRPIDVNETLLGGGTFLSSMVCRSDAADTLRWFLENYPVDVNKPHAVTGDTPLMLAVLGNQDTSVRILIEYGADRKISNVYGELPMTESLNSEIKTTLNSYFPPVQRTGVGPSQRHGGMGIFLAPGCNPYASDSGSGAGGGFAMPSYMAAPALPSYTEAAAIPIDAAQHTRLRQSFLKIREEKRQTELQQGEASGKIDPTFNPERESSKNSNRGSSTGTANGNQDTGDD
eukprot:ANDGO_08616.mRNA.1 hypothetical protein PTSG_12915